MGEQFPSKGEQFTVTTDRVDQSWVRDVWRCKFSNETHVVAKSLTSNWKNIVMLREDFEFHDANGFEAGED